MSVNINGADLRRGICIDKNSEHEIEEIKVRHGVGDKIYGGLIFNYSFVMEKTSNNLLGSRFRTYTNCINLLFNGGVRDSVSNVYIKGNMYVDTGDGTIFYNGSFEKTDGIIFNIEIPSTGTDRTIWNTEGYISIVVHLNFEYVITYDDGLEQRGNYSNSFYGEYGVNAASTLNFSSKVTAVPDSIGGLTVWTKDPLRVCRQQIGNVTINNVYVKSEYSGTTCGSDEYKYYVEGTPYFTILILQSAGKVKITNVKLTGFINITFGDTEVILEQNSETLEKAIGNEIGLISLEPTVNTRVSGTSVHSTYVDYTFEAEITYADGYIHKYVNKNKIIITKENETTSYVLDNNIPALKD